MKERTNRSLTLLVLAMGVSTFAFQGAGQGLQTITMQFTVDTGDPLAPTDPVTGTIVYTAASSLDPIQSFDSINMTIAGYTYSVGEIGFLEQGTDDFLIGGLVNGVAAIVSGTDDFGLTWNPVESTMGEFFYSTSEPAGIWPRSGPGLPLKESFPVFTITSAPVPEPSAWALLLLGAAIGCLSGVRTKRID